MSVSMFKLSVPVFIRGLNVLAGLLDKAESHAAQKKIPLENLFNARLAPDMLPLSAQIQRVSDTSKNTIGRLTGAAAPSFPDEEKTFAELRERIAKTIAYLETVKPTTSCATRAWASARSIFSVPMAEQGKIRGIDAIASPPGYPLEKPLDKPVRIQENLLRRWHPWQAWHGHDLAGDDDDEAGTGR
jgi:hypothetical protein